MPAVDDLLEHLGQVDDMVDFAASSVSSAPKHVIDGMLSGAAVRTFSAVETFVRSRAIEWSLFITGARWAPTRLPSGAANFQGRLVHTFPTKFEASNETARAVLAEELAKVLTSLNSSAVVGHPLLFGWNGSNMKESDVEAILRTVGVTKPWPALTRLWQLLDTNYPLSGQAKSIWQTVTEARHSAAHEVTPILDLTSMRSLTRSARLLSLLVDSAVSVALRAIADGVDPSHAVGHVRVRRIESIQGRWSEFGVPQGRALKRHSDVDAAFSAASQRTGSSGDLIVAYSGVAITNWRMPS